MVLIDGIAHLSTLFCQQIESSCGFISYNFNNSLQPDDVVEHIYIYCTPIYIYIYIYIYRGAIATKPVFGPSGRIMVLDDSLRRPFIIFLIANL
jgi:hypothetical protein